jgi:sugar phosphate isomerase/epimerase
LNGLAYEPVCKAISEIENAGFKGFEFSFNDQQLNPYRATDKYINDLINFLKTRDIKPVCISTATTFFLSTTPHEPSIISLDALSRSKRIELIKKGVDLAEKLNTPIVSFQSGYIRQENIENKDIKPIEFLKSGIDEILTYIGNRKITLVIEPEPGMFIETIKEGVDLIKIINSDKFKLHMDIGHTYCTEDNYLEAIENNINYTGYMHLADIKSGHALRFRQIESLNEITSQPDDNDDRICSIGDDILYHNANTIWNFYEKLDPDVNASLKKLVPDVRHIALEELKYQKISDDLKTEVKAYTDSIPGISLKTLEKTGLALAYLRNGSNPIIKMAICNTVKGKVHYHERLGFGEIDLKTCLKLIDKLEYDGFVTVELYNHTKMWEKVLPESYSFIQNFFTNYSKEAQHLIDE